MKLKRKPTHRKIAKKIAVAVLSLVASCLCAAPADAVVIALGDVAPGHPATWDAATNGYVGWPGSATVTVNGASQVICNNAIFGNNSGSDGTVLVTGTNSTWTVGTRLDVGLQGLGTLNIESGGKVVCNDSIFVGFNSTAAGSSITVTGGTLECGNELNIDYGSLTVEMRSVVAVGGPLTTTANSTLEVTGGALVLNGGDSDASFTVKNKGLVTGTGTFLSNPTKSIMQGGKSQPTGGALYTSGGAGYTITGTGVYTLATATYNVQPGGSLQSDNLWKLTAGDNPSSFVPGGPFAFGANDVFSTLDDCTNTDALNFGASTGGTININHEATITALNAASTAAVVIGAAGKISSTAALDMRNASGLTITIAESDFAAGRTVADLGASSWMVDPSRVTLNVAKSGGSGTVILATSTGTNAISTDGTTAVPQADLDSWIAQYGSGYTIGYDGFDLLLHRAYTPPALGDSNKVVVEKLIADGSIVLPPGMTTQDVIASLTATTGSTLTSFTAAREFGSILASRIGSIASRTNNNSLRGQQTLRDYRHGKTSLWLENVGAWTTQEAIGEATAGYNASLLGIQIGADRMFGRNFLVGISYGGAWATTRSDGQQMTTDIFDLQLYGAWRVSRNLRCIGSTGYQYMDYNGTFLGENSSHVGNMFKMAGAIEYDIHLGRIVLTPLYGWEYYKTDEDAYETGQFAVEGNSTEAIYQRLGMCVGVVCHPRIKVDLHSSWLHNFGDENIIFSAASGGTPFQLTGAPVHHDLGEMGLDTTLALSRSLDLTVGYLGVYANGFNTQSVNGLLRWSF